MDGPIRVGDRVRMRKGELAGRVGTVVKRKPDADGRDVLTVDFPNLGKQQRAYGSAVERVARR